MSDGISETAFLRQVLDLLAINDWLWHHDDSSARLIQRRSGALVRIANTTRGFPDICAARIRDGRVLFTELKGDVGSRGGTSHRNLSPEQEQWANALTRNMARPGSTIEYYIWRPRDLEAISKVLALR